MIAITPPRGDRPARSNSPAPIVALARAIARFRDYGASRYNTRFPMAAPELFLVEMQKDFRRQQADAVRTPMTGAAIKRRALAVAGKTVFTADDLRSQIITGPTHVTYRYGGEEYREPIGDAKEVMALLARMLKLPGLPVG